MKIEELEKYKKILILGYGIEGKATEKFLKKYCPESQIIIGDKNNNENYLRLQDQADLVIKTPSLPINLVTKPYTTATNIFFANVNNKIIGITGTKGKSTTASLVDHILKTSGRKSILAGNIGMPMLSIIDEILDNNNINSSSQNDKKMDETIIVLELSSYQLSDIKYSPHIGCILNIYPEEHK